jgi:N-acetylated-alpha-linked acidic dipeptidase
MGSGTAAMMEMARSMGNLMKGGWRPARSITVASWGGEEYGLLGRCKR